MFPSWRYHRTLPACIVEHPEADDALGEGWANTPAAFDELEPEPEPELDQTDDKCLNEKTKNPKNPKRTKS